MHSLERINRDNASRSEDFAAQDKAKADEYSRYQAQQAVERRNHWVRTFAGQSLTALMTTSEPVGPQTLEDLGIAAVNIAVTLVNELEKRGF